MKKYYTTIICLVTGGVQTFIKDDYNINECVQRELGGWDNLSAASTSNRGIDEDNYQMAGTTRDDLKAFSIICINDQWDKHENVTLTDEEIKASLLEAFKSGKTIQHCHHSADDVWYDFIPQNQLDKPNFNHGSLSNWRVKP